MSAIFEISNRNRNTLDLVDILTNFSFATIQAEHDYQ